MNINQIKEMIEPVLEEMEVRLYELKLIQDKEKTLQISILKNDGTMDLDTCALVSERISQLLDEKDPVDSEYMLEICSPGAEREIKDLSELATNTNAYIYVRLIHPIDKQKELTGEVLSFENDVITLEYRDKARKKKAEIEKENIEFIRHAVRI